MLKVGEVAIRGAFNLHHVTLSHDVVVKPRAFIWCLSIEVLAASIWFEPDTGGRFYSRNDPTAGITSFSKWRNQMGNNKEYYKTATGMFELANTPLPGNIGMRASTEDPIWVFVAGPGRDKANLILPFKLGVKIVNGDSREASKAKLLEVGLELGLELKAIRMENNRWNMGHWGVVVDEEGKAIERGIREAGRRGLVTEARCLEKMGNGDVYGVFGSYGDEGVVYWRLVDSVIVLV